MKISQKIGRNLTVNILIIKQYVIIRVFPVYTGINRIRGLQEKSKRCVPCMHRDKPIYSIDKTRYY